MGRKGSYHFLKISFSILTVALLLFTGLQTFYPSPVFAHTAGASDDYSVPSSQHVSPLAGQSHVNNQTPSASPDTMCKSCNNSNCIRTQNKDPIKSRTVFTHLNSISSLDLSSETNLTFDVTNLSLGMSWNIAIFRSYISLATYISDKLCTPYYSKTTSSTSLTVLIPTGTYFYAFGPLNTYTGMFELYVHGKTDIVNLTLPTLYQIKFRITNQPTNIETDFDLITSNYSLPLETAYYNSSISNITIAYLPKFSYCLSFGPESTFYRYGLLNVNSSASINLTLEKTYEINLTFANKPMNAIVCMYIHTFVSNIRYCNVSNSSEMVAYLPNCTYQYSAILENSLTFNRGDIFVSGKPVNVTISLKRTYNVSFNLAGSNVNSCWYLTMCGHITSNCCVKFITYTREPQISLFLSNGSYKVYHGYYYPCLIRSSFFFGNQLDRSISSTFNVTGTSLSFVIILPQLYEVSFEAKGLLFSGDWVISFPNADLHTGTIDSGILNLSLPNGTYYFVASEVDYSKPLASLVLNGRNITEVISFPKLYSLNLEAPELPNNAQWCITVYNDSLFFFYKNSSKSTDITAYVPNGTFNYTYGLSYGRTSVELGKGLIAVSGSGRTLCLFIPRFYTVNILEQNLIYPLSWSVTISNSNGSVNYRNMSVSQVMKAYLPQGTFNYSSQSTYLNGPTAEFNVSVNTTLQLVFPKSFKVDFTEANLQNNTFWYICISGSGLRSIISNSTCGTNMTEYLPVGIYNYSSFANVFSKCKVEFSVNGNETVYVVYPKTYNITFCENVLPAGTRWYLFFSGSNLLESYDYSEGNNLSQYFANGTYTYTACALDFRFAKVNFTVNGSSESIRVNIQKFYGITFYEHNAIFNFNSCCYYWTLRVSSPNYFYFKLEYTSNVTIFLPNGTYSYRAVDYFQSLNNTLFNVTGKNMTVEVDFLKLYRITFEERGFNRLEGNLWFVLITGKNQQPRYFDYLHSNSSTATTVGSNDTYSYFVDYRSGDRWCVNPENGTFVINGRNITIDLQFKQVFQVSFLYEISGAKFYWTLSDLYAHSLPPDNASPALRNVPICAPPADELTSQGVLLTTPMISSYYTQSEAMRSNQSFKPPFTIQVNASVLSGCANAFQIMLYNLNRSKCLDISEGALFIHSEEDHVIAYHLYDNRKCVAFGILNKSAEYGAIYDYIISVNQTGFANITILLGNLSVGFVSGINVSKGPFYVAIGQLDYPFSLLPVALLKSASLASPDNRSSTLVTSFSNPPLELRIDGRSYGAFLNSTDLMLPNGTYSYTVVYYQSGVTYCNGALAITVASGNLTVNGQNVSITVTVRSENFNILGLNSSTFYTIIFILIGSLLVTGAAVFYYRKR